MKENKEIEPRREKSSGSIASILTGSALSQENVVKQLPFIFFLTFLTLLYIANGFMVESSVREIERTSAEIKELRSEQISIKSELNNTIIESELKKIIADRGIPLIESRIPPQKLEVNKSDIKEIY